MLSHIPRQFVSISENCSTSLKLFRNMHLCGQSFDPNSEFVVCRAEEQARRYAVPSYDEAVGSGQYPVRESGLPPASSHLPSYDDLVQVDGLQYEFEGPEAPGPGAPPPAGPAAASSSNRRPGKSSRKLLPIKIRRIKSEKLHMKNVEPAAPPGGFSIEPLTPPPQYEDKVPPI